MPKWLIIVCCVTYCLFPTSVNAQLAVSLRCACQGAEVVEKKMRDELQAIPDISVVSAEKARVLLSVVAMPLTLASRKVGYAYALTVILKFPVAEQARQNNSKVSEALASNGAYLTQYMGMTGLSASSVESSVADFVSTLDAEVFAGWRH